MLMFITCMQWIMALMICQHPCAPTCSHVYPCAGTPCDKLLDEVYDDLKDINLYDILWTCYHGGRPRQEALMQVTASLTHYTSLLLSSCGGNIVVPPLKKCSFNSVTLGTNTGQMLPVLLHLSSPEDAVQTLIAHWVMSSVHMFTYSQQI